MIKEKEGTKAEIGTATSAGRESKGDDRSIAWADEV